MSGKVEPFRVDLTVEPADVAADLVVGLAYVTGTVGAVAGGEWPCLDASARCSALERLVITGTSLVELAAALTTGDARRRLESAVDVLDRTPFGAGDWGRVDVADIGDADMAVLAAVAS